jgi:hypothetical protein
VHNLKLQVHPLELPLQVKILPGQRPTDASRARNEWASQVSSAGVATYFVQHIDTLTNIVALLITRLPDEMQYQRPILW